jgi:hypothetical protein
VTPPSDFTVPPCGLQDVDEALFTAFETDIGFAVAREDEPTRRPHVLFASGEKWAQIKKRKGLRDQQGALILPLITIVRTALAQDPAQDVTGRGINQQTGEIVVRRRLDVVDRGNQALINRFFLRNQQNVAVPRSVAAPGQLATERPVGVDEGVPRMAADRKSCVFETISVPSPQFFTATYDVTFWAQYLTHMNQLWERMTGALLQQGSAIVLETPKGYWFVATVEGGAFSPENNFDDTSTSERVIKHKFTVKVPAYKIAGSEPGAPVPVRRVVSSPNVRFETRVQEPASEVDDPNLGADDPTLPLETGTTRRHDARRTGGGRLTLSTEAQRTDPAVVRLPRGQSVMRYRRRTEVGPDGRIRERLERVTSTIPRLGETAYTSSKGALDPP